MAGLMAKGGINSCNDALEEVSIRAGSFKDSPGNIYSVLISLYDSNTKRGCQIWIPLLLNGTQKIYYRSYVHNETASLWAPITNSISATVESPYPST